jgi:hypothetical protein
MARPAEHVHQEVGAVFDVSGGADVKRGNVLVQRNMQEGFKKGARDREGEIQNRMTE